ncbi:hypothetical protein C7M51_04426 (plasmid) [Mixta intestinalis]|uniref:Uncharacterized protein n=1 Tax=Mixta intestinalis TaxID=1615494 RepID=A0A6P1Q8H3_9GAMM|nr:hypothetical protein C7M51_04426 [Mixta intestinalis]
MENSQDENGVATGMPDEPVPVVVKARLCEPTRRSAILTPEVL